MIGDSLGAGLIAPRQSRDRNVNCSHFIHETKLDFN